MAVFRIVYSVVKGQALHHALRNTEYPMIANRKSQIVSARVDRMKALLAVCCCGLAGLADTGRAASLSDPIVYRGMCDASAAVSLTTNLFIVANDEDNILRVYRRHPGGLPMLSIDLNAFLRV